MSETTEPPKSSHAPAVETTEKPTRGLGYKGPVSGLKGLLSSRLAEGIAQVAQGIDKVGEIVQGVGAKTAEAGTVPIPIEQIYPCPDQPRQVFEPKALEELSQTFREIGQAQAITVRKTPQGYEIISGERRFRAAKLAGFTHLDCVVKQVSRTEGRLLALVENTQRQDLLPIEEAEFLRKVLDENPDLSLEKLAKQLGTHKSTLSEKIQMCEVPEELKQQLFSKGRFFTHRHWRVVSRVSDRALCRQMIELAVEEHLSVAELERAIGALGDSALRVRQRKGNKLSAKQKLASLKAETVFKINGRNLKINSNSYDLARITPEFKAELVKTLEDLIYEIKKEVSPVSVSQPNPNLSELILKQKPSIEVS